MTRRERDANKLQQENARQKRQIDGLRRQDERQKREIEDLKRQLAAARRAGCRQAAPFAKNRPQGRGGAPAVGLVRSTAGMRAAWYKLIAYGIVGLPLYRLTTVGLCLAKKSLDPIEEFVLRSVLAGAECVEDVAGVLGLKPSVVESCLANLLRSEYVKVPAGAGTAAPRQVELTPKGKDLARGEEAIIPVEQTVVFYVDGLTRAPRFYPFERLYRPRDLKDLGIPEIRAFPARAPELDEIDIKDVIEVVRLDAGPAESPRHQQSVR